MQARRFRTALVLALVAFCAAATTTAAAEPQGAGELTLEIQHIAAPTATKGQPYPVQLVVTNTNGEPVTANVVLVRPVRRDITDVCGVPDTLLDPGASMVIDCVIEIEDPQACDLTWPHVIATVEADGGGTAVIDYRFSIDVADAPETCPTDPTLLIRSSITQTGPPVAVGATSTAVVRFRSLSEVELELIGASYRAVNFLDVPAFASCVDAIALGVRLAPGEAVSLECMLRLEAPVACDPVLEPEHPFDVRWTWSPEEQFARAVGERFTMDVAGVDPCSGGPIITPPPTDIGSDPAPAASVGDPWAPGLLTLAASVLAVLAARQRYSPRLRT